MAFEIVVCCSVQCSTCSWVEQVIGTQLYVREDGQKCLRQPRIDSMVIEVEYPGAVAEIVAELCMKRKRTA